jgi:ATP synthase protein I
MAEGPEKPSTGEASAMRQWSSMAGIGVEFVAALVVPGLIGYWVDRKFGTAPWGLLVGGGLGFAAGLINLVRVGNKAMK